MCGITGAVWTDPAKALEPAALQRMTTVIRETPHPMEGRLMFPLKLVA
jgi:hypothetical protein